MSQNALSKKFAQLYAFLVKAVDVPYEALEHDLVLEVSKESAEGLGSELLAGDDAGRTSARERLVGVLIILAACERHDLCYDVCAELLLAGAALDDNIHACLVLFESYELHGNNVCALVKQLIERVLSVGSGLTEDDRTCGIVDGLAEAVDGLAVGFHIQLLQVCREAVESLGIRQDCCAQIAESVSLIDADQGIQKSCVLPDIGILSQLVGLCRAVHDRCEYFGAKSQRKYNRAYTGRRGIAAADEVIHEECFTEIRTLCKRGSLTGNSKHMLGGIYACILEGIPYEGLVGQGLQSCSGLGNNDEQGAGWT